MAGEILTYPAYDGTAQGIQPYVSGDVYNVSNDNRPISRIHQNVLDLEAELVSLGLIAEQGSGIIGAGGVAAFANIDLTTLTAIAGSVTGGQSETFNIGSGSSDELLFAIDGGGDQPVTLTAGAARTAQEIVADINAALTGATAYVVGDIRVNVTSDTKGASSSVEIKAVAADAYTELGFTEAVYSGAAGITSYYSNYGGVGVGASSEGFYLQVFYNGVLATPGPNNDYRESSTPGTGQSVITFNYGVFEGDRLSVVVRRL